MKKLYLFLFAAAIGGTAFGQAQRTVLVEHFTQASCGPCATYNPGVKTLLDANPTKAIAIKYQTSWPGVDPMNAQNPGQVADRVAYYNISGVPSLTLDGDPVGSGSSAGHPQAFNQLELDNAYGVSTPFNMGVTHTVSSDYDSVFISVTVTAAGPFSVATPGNLKLRVALVEELIAFDIAPGTNGEKNFYNVMRKMFPNTGGTVLADSWTTSQNATFTFAEAMPSYIYNKSKVNIIAFVQDDTDKNVKQVAKSLPVPVQFDGGVSSFSNVPVVTCSSSFTPTITIKNFGTSTLSSGTINYQMGTGSVQTSSWTGSIAPGATGTHILPAVTIPAGNLHTFKAWFNMPNGNTDYNAGNDQSTTSIAIPPAAGSMPVNYNFEGLVGTNLPSSFIKLNPDGAASWDRRSGNGFGGSGYSARMYFYASPAGAIDEMIIQPLDLTNFVTGTYSIQFDVAYATYQAEADQLEVLISTDCGTTWTTAYDKAGTALQTAPATQASFVPTPSQWRTETIPLNNYLGEDHVLVKFKATSAYGNNLYVDNINIDNITSVEEITDAFSLNMYPNPAAEAVNFSFENNADKVISIRIIDATGRVHSENSNSYAAGNNLVTVSTAELPTGMYLVTITDGENMYTRKLQVVK